jgi:hypothetical protein
MNIDSKYEGVYLEVKVKVKVRLFLYYFLTEHHAMKAYWGVEV